MQRLEIMQHLALQAQAEANGQPLTVGPGFPAVRRRSRRAAQLIVLAWFSFGVVASGAAGFGALQGLKALEARGTPFNLASVRTALGSTLASAWAMVPPMAFKTRPEAGGRWDRLEVRIDAGKRAQAPLGLQVTGGNGRPLVFVLEGLPSGVRPSHGAAVGPGTWVVSSADIGLLYLTLDEGAPSAFDLKIALLEPTGVAKSGSVVEVRMVDPTAPMQARASTPKAAPESGPVALAGVGR